MKLEHDDDYRDDDNQEPDERDEFGSRSIFAAGWFRAALVLTTLAIALVVSLPYLLNWFEPASAPKVAKPDAARMAESRDVSATSAPSAPASAPATSPPAALSPPETRPSASSQVPAKTRTAPDVAVPGSAAPRNRADKPAAVAKSEERPSPPSRPARAESPVPAADKSDRYWVQLGAFRDGANAEALAKNVRNDGFAVQVTQVTRGNATAQVRAQRHELFVTQARAEKVGASLKGRGRAESAPGGVIVKPAFSLEDAMTVSRQLTADGFNVVIRPAAAESDNTVHVVRAGGYSDRTRAAAARDALKAKGHDGFVAEGPAR